MLSARWGPEHVHSRCEKKFYPGNVHSMLGGPTDRGSRRYATCPLLMHDDSKAYNTLGATGTKRSLPGKRLFQQSLNTDPPREKGAQENVFAYSALGRFGVCMSFCKNTSLTFMSMWHFGSREPKCLNSDTERISVLQERISLPEVNLQSCSFSSDHRVNLARYVCRRCCALMARG